MNILLTTVCLFIAVAAHTQNQPIPPQQNIVEKISFAKKGTFQIIFSSENDQLVSLDSDLLQKIELNRLENEVSYLKLSENTVVKIFPMSEINATQFEQKSATVINPEFIQQYNKQ